MATLINGNGNPAVYANQDADLIASICGDTTCISAVGSQFAATQEDANTIGLADGVIITKEGRRIQLDAGYTDLFTIPTGTAGTTSYYIIGYKLTTGSDSKQTCETFVQKMNSSSETITEDTFRGGASDVYVSVYRVVQDGLNIDSINGLLPTLSLGAQTSSSHSGSGSTVTTTLAANKTLDEVTQRMLDNDYALKSALGDKVNTTTFNKFVISSNSNYTVLNKSINANSSYTAPADGLYIFDLETGSGGYAAYLYLDADRTKRIARSEGSQQGDTSSFIIPLKANTTIYTRSHGTYLVVGYIS
jgi:hypothetical protein